MRLVRRPNRRLGNVEKALSLVSFIILFIIFTYSFKSSPPTYQPPKLPQEKYYLVPISKSDISKIEKVLGHHLQPISDR
jgi:hypothetical protein